MRDNKWYNDNKNTIIDMYYSGVKIPNICNILECNKSMIYRKFNEWNIERRDRINPPERHNAIYNVDSHYFDKIDCEHKAYWLGFIVSDGFVNEREVSLCLKKLVNIMVFIMF